MGLVGLARADLKVSQEDMTNGKAASKYTVLARRVDDLRSLPHNPAWQPLPTDPAAPVWTDQCSNILDVFRWR
jgi:hypothetical protein